MGRGTKCGIMLLFGVMGIVNSLESLRGWARVNGANTLFVLLVLAGVAIFVLLSKLRLKWLVIPACALAALSISWLYGLRPKIDTAVALPIINPGLWWNIKWGIGFGLNPGNFITALPFALLAVVMWPIDALTIKSMSVRPVRL